MEIKASIRPQKICFVITKSNWGGAGRYVFDLATAFSAKGYIVSVICGGGGELVDRLREAHITVHTITSLGRDIYPLQDFISFIRLVQLLKKESPNILHLNSSKIGGLGAIAGRVVGIPRIIFTAHGWAFNEQRPPYQKYIIHKLSELIVLLSHRTIAVSQRMAIDLAAPHFIQKKITVIHNGISPLIQKEKDAFWQEQSIEVNHGMRILSIGELHTSKGYDIALSYLKKLKDVPWTYHILGEGDEQANLEKEVKKFGLEERVFFYGYVEKASSYMNSFDIFFLPSRTEALGYVVIEALNTSIPIVAHAVGGVPEIIKHDEGSLLLSLGAKKNIGLLRGILNRTTMLDTSKREALRIPFTKEAMVVATEKVYLG